MNKNKLRKKNKSLENDDNSLSSPVLSTKNFLDMIRNIRKTKIGELSRDSKGGAGHHIIDDYPVRSCNPPRRPNDPNDFLKLTKIKYGTPILYSHKANPNLVRSLTLSSGVGLSNIPDKIFSTPTDNELRSGLLPIGRSHHSAVVDGHKMYIFGGEGQTSTELDILEMDDFWCFDFLTNCWTALPSSGTPPSSRSMCAMACYNHKIYIIGGTCDIREELFEYDIETGIWRELKPKGKAFLSRLPAIMVAIDNALYVVGTVVGIDVAGFDVPDNHNVMKYDIESNSWSVIKTSGDHLPDLVSEYSVCVANDKVYFGMGVHSSGTTVADPVSSLYEWDPKSKEWTCLVKHQHITNPPAVFREANNLKHYQTWFKNTMKSTSNLYGSQLSERAKFVASMKKNDPKSEPMDIPSEILRDLSEMPIPFTFSENQEKILKESEDLTSQTNSSINAYSDLSYKGPKFTEPTSVPHGRIGHGMVYLNGSIFIIFGSVWVSDSNLDSECLLYDNIWSFNLKERKWNHHPNPRPDLAVTDFACVTWNNKIYIHGGMKELRGYTSDMICMEIDKKNNKIKKVKEEEPVRNNDTMFPNFTKHVVQFNESGLSVCVNCQKPERKYGEFKRCARCKEVSYCSRNCQVKHWKKGHKEHCSDLIKERETLTNLTELMQKYID